MEKTWATESWEQAGELRASWAETSCEQEQARTQDKPWELRGPRARGHPKCVDPNSDAVATCAIFIKILSSAL